MYRKPTDPVAKELDAIKKLLILQLVTSGVQSKDIAKVLGLDKSDLSRLVSSRGIKKKANDKSENAPAKN
jgi:predicted transcriptional regulator